MTSHFSTAASVNAFFSSPPRPPSETIETIVLQVLATPTKVGGIFTRFIVDNPRFGTVTTFDDVDVRAGDLVRFTGTVSDYKGSPQLGVDADDVKILMEDHVAPQELARLRNVMRHAKPFHFESTLSNFYIQSRHSNASEVVIGLYAQQRESVKNFDFVRVHGTNANAIELTSSLRFGAGVVFAEQWGKRTVRIFEPTSVEIVPFEPKLSPKIDGLDSATCARLAKCLGDDYARQIAEDPSALKAFRFSSEKAQLVKDAAIAETKARAREKRTDKVAFKALLAAGLSRAKARDIVGASNADLKDEPFQPRLFRFAVFQDRRSFRGGPQSRSLGY